MKKINSKISNVLLTSNFRSLIPKKSVFITHRKLYDIYLKNVDAIFVPEGEKTKSIDVVKYVIKELIKRRFERFQYLVAFGGGVVGDLTGFVASIYKRGVPYIQIPTTLLAMVDAAIGGKTGVDFDGVKNVVGSFYQPEYIIVNIEFLKTLPDIEYKNGTAEILKYAFIKDPNLIDKIEKDIEYVVYRCIKIKIGIVEKDEKETKGIRELLNFGHTVGHGFETASNYMLPHGSSIAMGMIAETWISHIYGLEKEILKFVIDAIKRYGFNFYDFNDSRVLKAIENDKKIRSGKLRCVLLKKLGFAYVREIERIDVIKSLKFLRDIEYL
ncbi:MAG: 3-dehydroquinate synthase [bacterium]|nr:3-dehydroquinate synthase [bacterium]